MLEKLFVFVTLATLMACTTVKDVYLPDGSRGYYVGCDGLTTGSADCYKKAGDICGAKGYNLASVPGAGTSSRDLFLKCKD